MFFRFFLIFFNVLVRSSSPGLNQKYFSFSSFFLIFLKVMVIFIFLNTKNTFFCANTFFEKIFAPLKFILEIKVNPRKSACCVKQRMNFHTLLMSQSIHISTERFPSLGKIKKTKNYWWVPSGFEPAPSICVILKKKRKKTKKKFGDHRGSNPLHHEFVRY